MEFHAIRAERIINNPIRLMLEAVGPILFTFFLLLLLRSANIEGVLVRAHSSQRSLNECSLSDTVFLYKTEYFCTISVCNSVSLD